jgi:hypothetical protein
VFLIGSDLNHQHIIITCVEYLDATPFWPLARILFVHNSVSRGRKVQCSTNSPVPQCRFMMIFPAWLTFSRDGERKSSASAIQKTPVSKAEKKRATLRLVTALLGLGQVGPFAFHAYQGVTFCDVTGISVFHRIVLPRQISLHRTCT